MKQRLYVTFSAILISTIFFGQNVLAHVGGKANAGYVGDASGHLITDGFGDCVRTGVWTPALALPGCDPGLIKKKPEPVPVTVAPKPEPEPVTPAPTQAVSRTVSLGAGALFGFNKDSMKTEGRTELDALANQLKNLSAVSSIKIVGHTDSKGPAAYNQILSENRANTVKEYLINQGIDSRIITSSGAGETQPVASNNTDDGRAQNRRVEIHIKGTEIK